MPKKCESCRFFYALAKGDFDNSICTNVDVNGHTSVNFAEVPTMTEARQICDREGDGIFVYFEPKEPHAGAAVEQSLRAAA